MQDRIDLDAIKTILKKYEIGELQLESVMLEIEEYLKERGEE